MAGDFVAHGEDSIADVTVLLERVIKSRKIVAKLMAETNVEDLKGDYDGVAMLTEVLHELGTASLLAASLLDMTLGELMTIERSIEV